MGLIGLWVDGAASPNPGRGGCAVLVIKNGEVVRKIVESFVQTTNNRMELMAVLLGLSAVDGANEVVIYSDSVYTVRGITAENPKKVKLGYPASSKTRYKENRDLWDKVLTLCRGKKVRAVYVKAHAGARYNEVANTLAQEATWALNSMKHDDGYIPQEF